MAAAEPIRTKKQIKELTNYYISKGERRNYLLAVMGIYTALRISDLLSLHWKDVYDFTNSQFKTTFSLTEKKTGKQKTVALNKHVIDALTYYRQTIIDLDPRAALFPGKKNACNPITRIQAYRIIKKAAEYTGITGNISCHSLRKTFGYHAWKTNIPIAVIMDIYNHSSFDVTRRYLGICQDDKNRVYMSISFF